MLGGTLFHDLLDQSAIGLAAVGLLASLAEPAVLRKRQADDVDVPVLDGHVDRFENVPLAVAGEFHAGGIDALQTHRMILAVENLRAGHFQWQRLPCPCCGLAAGDGNQRGGGEKKHGG